MCRLHGSGGVLFIVARAVAAYRRRHTIGERIRRRVIVAARGQVLCILCVLCLLFVRALL